MKQPYGTPLTSDSFYEFVRMHRFVVIHFWAPWNGYDPLMKRLLEARVPAEFNDLIAFASLHADLQAHNELCRQHNVLNVPFLAVYRDGSLIRSVTGMRTPEVVELVGMGTGTWRIPAPMRTRRLSAVS